jgi:hypothetical protein
MTKPNEHKVTRDEIWELFFPGQKAPPPKVKPVVSAGVPVSEKLAQAAKANPESVKVRVTARGSDGVVVVDPPRSARIVDEAEQQIRLATQQRSEARVERERVNAEAWRYRPAGEVAHIYNPLDRLGE